MAVPGRSDGAHDLARRVLALLAGHWLKISLRICLSAFVVGIDSKPVHLAAARDLFLPYYRYVVFGDARDDAGTAADARVQINRHAPGVAVVLEFRIQRFFRV